MSKRIVLWLTVFGLLSCAAASATELVANGSFETGTFAGWTPNVIGTPFIPWLISPAGLGSGYSMAPTLPQAGQLDAWNGFDGSGPMMYTLYQDIKIPQFLASPAILTWKDRVQWNFALTASASQPRTYAVEVRTTSGTLLTTLYSFSTGTALVIGDTSWKAHSADLSALAGSTVRLWFQENIPEMFTGPGQFELDSVSLNVSEYVAIDACNTGIVDRVINPATGATLQDFINNLVDSCTAGARNHGAIVSCVSQGLNAAKGSVLNGQEKGAVTACTAQTARRGRY